MVGVGVVGTAAFWVLSRFGFVFVEGLRTLRGLRLSAIFALFDFELDGAAMEALSRPDRGEAGRTGPHPDRFDYVPD
jgi:2,5-diketo-D-gluconate reductase A